MHSHVTVSVKIMAKCIMSFSSLAHIKMGGFLVMSYKVTLHVCGYVGCLVKYKNVAVLLKTFALWYC